jgi:hypothetical protein
VSFFSTFRLLKALVYALNGNYMLNLVYTLIGGNLLIATISPFMFLTFLDEHVN